MKIVLYYHTLVSNHIDSTNICTGKANGFVIFQICTVLRNFVPMVRAHAAVELQKAFKAPVY